MGALLDTAVSSCTRGLLAEVRTVAPVIILPLIASAVSLSAVMAFARMAEAVTDPTAIYLAVTGTAAVLTFGATLISTWVGLRTRPAVAAVAPA